MTDKVLCPWCGSEMSACYSRGKVFGEWKDYYDAHLRCTGCGAQGPFARRNTPEGAKEAARAAALRRYTPQIKPMTLEEALDKDAFLELKWMNSIRQVRVPRHLGERIELLLVDSPIEGCYSEWTYRDDYGKTWRCWSRKPTKEEMEAAKWEK